MLENLVALASNPLLDFALKIVGVVGLIIGAMALKAANAAVQATKASDTINLKMMAMEHKALAESALVSLQSARRGVDTSWQQHIAKHYGGISFHRYQPDELSRNAGVEREGEHLMCQLTEKFENIDLLDHNALEESVNAAQRTTVAIERLILRLEGPPARRY